MSPYRKGLISSFAVAFLDNFGYSLVFILFAPLVLNPEYGFFSADLSVGSKNGLLGVLIGIFPFSLFFGAPFWGDIGDHWGRKKGLVWTLAGTLLGHLATGAAIWLQNYPLLLLARAVSGFLAGNVSICLAILADLSPDSKTQGRNFGLFSVFMGAGWILAMVAGGYLSDPSLSSLFNPALPFYVASVLTLFGLLIVQFLFEESHSSHRREIHFHWMKSISEIRSALKIEPMRPFLWILLFWSLGWFFTFQWFAPVSLELFGVDQETVSSRLVVLGICWILGGSVLNPFLLKKWTSRTLSISSIFFVAVFVFLCSISRSYFPFSLFFSLSALAAPICLSNILNQLSLSAPEGVQGKAMGFSQSLQALAGIAVPFAGGAIAHFSAQAIYPLSGVFLLVSGVLFLITKK